jgi:hypothetical protein
VTVAVEENPYSAIYISIAQVLKGGKGVFGTCWEGEGETGRLVDW